MFMVLCGKQDGNLKRNEVIVMNEDYEKERARREKESADRWERERAEKNRKAEEDRKKEEESRKKK
jgi:hypothetical protein